MFAVFAGKDRVTLTDPQVTTKTTSGHGSQSQVGPTPLTIVHLLYRCPLFDRYPSGWVLQSLSDSPFSQRFHISAFSGFLFLLCSLQSCLSIAAWLKMLKNIMVSCAKCLATQCVRYMEDRQIHEDLRYVLM